MSETDPFGWAGGKMYEGKSFPKAEKYISGNNNIVSLTFSYDSYGKEKQKIARRHLI